LEFLSGLVQLAEIVDVQDSITACRDPKDDKFLELAVSGQADVIVTGDADLLTLHPFQGIEVLSPAAFVLRHSGAAQPPQS
jgi:predicted nucleic acid-binding protein